MPSYLLETTFYIGLFAAAVRIAAPLALAAMGEAFAELGGVLNIGLEGTMLLGAWAAFMGMYLSGSGLVGVLCGMLGGMAACTILGFVCVVRGANQIVAGIVLNIFAVGFTSLVYRHTYRGAPPSIESFVPIPIPYLSRIPVLGRIMFDHTILVYTAFLLIPIAAFLIYYTNFGLSLRAAGENPAAVDTAGGNVIGVRFAGLLICGSFAGLGGATLSIGQLDYFTDNLTAGRGYIALAIVLLGRWNPLKVMFGAMVFAFADALQLRLQVLGSPVPKEFLGMLPYALAIVAMAVFVRKLRVPAATSLPYVRES